MSHDPNDFIEAELDIRLATLEQVFDADVLAFVGPIITGVDLAIRDAIDIIQAKRPKLAVVIETDGGYIEVTSRIADTLRHHYQHVDFIVPNHAMSAGTVLVLSGDAIHMDYFAVLGPIDPQIEKPDGSGFIPALGYLEQSSGLSRNLLAAI